MKVSVKFSNYFFATIVLFIYLSCNPFNVNAQVGINNTDPKASLDISASNITSPSNTDGLLIPRIEDFPLSDPTADQQGMMVYLTTTSGSNPPGFYYWNNNAGPAAWVSVAGAKVDKIDDLTDGKSDSDGSQNGSSVFLGVNAGANDDSSNNRNVGVGYQSLSSNSTGTQNTAVGSASLSSNTIGFSNTAIGFTSLFSNTTGVGNIAIGVNTLLFNTTGSYNTSLGLTSLRLNTTGADNTAIGAYSLYSKTTGSSNNALGRRSLYSNTTGNNNTALGARSLDLNTTGNNNTALGNRSGGNNITGSSNVFIGYLSGLNETGSNKLYIENSNANSNNALIYGEFDNNILRINGELQIGNSSGTGYIFPTTDGASGQVITTNGSGQLSFVTRIAAEKIDDLTDGKSDSDGTNDGSSVFLGINAGQADNSNNNMNVGIGFNAMLFNTSGYNNTAVGYQALRSNTMGYRNVTIGYQSGYLNTTGYENISLGHQSLYNNTAGFRNFAAGFQALYNNTDGGNNIGIGYRVMQNNTSGSGNIAFGGFALSNNSLGGSNIAVGYSSLTSNVLGFSNIALGSTSLNDNTTGSSNVALGYDALHDNTTGFYNVALGREAGEGNSTGSRNISIGYQAGASNTASDRLYIESSNANADNALIYGEFDNDILRTNGEFQIGNPTGTGYAFPNVDSTNGYMLQTDGAGQLSFVNPNTIFIDTDDQTIDTFNFNTFSNIITLEIENDGIAAQTVDLSSLIDADWYSEGGTIPATSINDDIYTQGNVSIGDSNALYPFNVTTTTDPITMELNNAKTGISTAYGIENNLTGTGHNKVGLNNILSGTGANGGQIKGINNSISQNAANATFYGMFNRYDNATGLIGYGIYNRFSSTSSFGNQVLGVENYFDTTTPIAFGIRNIFNGNILTNYGAYNSNSSAVGSDNYGVYTLFSNTGLGNHYGSYTSLTGTGSGEKYGHYISIPNTAGGNVYGIYSDVDDITNGYAGYFLGRFAIGSLTSNTYIFPQSRGTNNQIMKIMALE